MNTMNNAVEASGNATTKIIIALVVGLIVGFATGAFWQDRRGDDVGASQANAEEKSEKADDKKAENNTAAVKEAIEAGSGAQAIMVLDQIAAQTVLVDSITAEEPIWVAVREERDGGLGNILGAQKVFPGAQTNITVSLLRPTEAGQNYFVVLYRDIGSPAFNYQEDVLIEGVQGTFKVN